VGCLAGDPTRKTETWKPGEYSIRRDEPGDVPPNEVGWNDLGYLYDGVVRHPVEVL